MVDPSDPSSNTPNQVPSLPSLPLRRKSASTERAIKVVMVGDQSVGISSLLHAQVGAEPPPNQKYSRLVHHFNQRSFQMDLWKTGPSDGLRERRTVYPGTEVLFLVFDMTNRESLHNTAGYWLSEFREVCKDALAVVLVGNKYDLWLEHKSAGLDVLSFEQVQQVRGLSAVALILCVQVAQQVGAETVVATSANTGLGVAEESFGVYHCQRSQKVPKLADLVVMLTNVRRDEATGDNPLLEVKEVVTDILEDCVIQ